MGQGRPTYVTDGMLWIDNTNPAALVLFLANGASDIELGRQAGGAWSAPVPAGLIKADGTVPMAAALDLASHELINVAAPSAAASGVPRSYVDAADAVLDARVDALEAGGPGVVAGYLFLRRRIFDTPVTAAIYVPSVDCKAMIVELEGAGAGGGGAMNTAAGRVAAAGGGGGGGACSNFITDSRARAANQRPRRDGRR
jgi:hypothetical protein